MTIHSLNEGTRHGNKGAITQDYLLTINRHKEGEIINALPGGSRHTDVSGPGERGLGHLCPR